MHYDQVKNAPITEVIDWWQDWWQGTTPDWADSLRRYFEDLGERLRGDSQGVQFLRSQAQSTDTVTKGRALLELSYPQTGDGDVQAWLVAAFSESIDSLTWVALFGLHRLKRWLLPPEKVRALTNHAEPGITFAAIAYLCDAEPGAAAEVLLIGMGSEQDWVRAYACAQAAVRDVRSLRAQIAPLCADSSRDVAKWAQEALQLFAIRDNAPN
jgi:hypothetical protein